MNCSICKKNEPSGHYQIIIAERITRIITFDDNEHKTHSYIKRESHDIYYCKQCEKKSATRYRKPYLYLLLASSLLMIPILIVNTTIGLFLNLSNDFANYCCGISCISLFILLLIVPVFLKPPTTYGLCEETLKKRLKTEGKTDILKMFFFTGERWKEMEKYL